MPSAPAASPAWAAPQLVPLVRDADDERQRLNAGVLVWESDKRTALLLSSAWPPGLPKLREPRKANLAVSPAVDALVVS